MDKMWGCEKHKLGGYGPGCPDCIREEIYEAREEDKIMSDEELKRAFTEHLYVLTEGTDVNDLQILFEAGHLLEIAKYYARQEQLRVLRRISYQSKSEHPDSAKEEDNGAA